MSSKGPFSSQRRQFTGVYILDLKVHHCKTYRFSGPPKKTPLKVEQRNSSKKMGPFYRKISKGFFYELHFQIEKNELKA